MTPTPQSPRPTLDQEAVWTHLRAALDRRTPLTFWTSLADIPLLLDEIDRLQSLLTWTRMEFADLLAATRATLTATEEGDPDALSYLRDQVATHNPTEGAR